MPKIDYTSWETAFDSYKAHIISKPGDLTFSILRNHLAIEQLVRDYVGKLAQSAAALESLERRRPGFAMWLDIARTFSPPHVADDWCWEAAQKLNSLRNELAHQLTPAKFKERLTAYIRAIDERIPLPPFAPEESFAPTSANPDPVRYTVIDMVSSLLFSRMADLFAMYEEPIAAPK